MRLLALLVLTVAATVASAADRGWYVFVEGGAPSSKASVGHEDADAALAASGFGVIASTESHGETSFTLGVGYTLLPYLALEAQYIDLGQLHQQSATFRAGANSGNRVNEWEAAGVGLALRAWYPLPHGFAVFAKAAVYRLDGDFRTATLILTPSGQIVSNTEARSSGSGTVPAIGAGVAYSVTEHISVRATYERLRDKSGMFGPASTDLERIQILALGASYRF